MNGGAFSKISKNKVTSQSIPKFSKVFAEVFFPFNFARGKLEFSVELFWFRKFNYFRNFWKLFRENSVPFAAVSKFSKVLVDAKCQSHALRQEHQGFLPFTKTTWPEVLLFRLKSCARRCRSSMTTAITFSRENDAGSHTRTSLHYLVLKNLVLVVVFVLESKGLFCEIEGDKAWIDFSVLMLFTEPS